MNRLRFVSLSSILATVFLSFPFVNVSSQAATVWPGEDVMVTQPDDEPETVYDDELPGEPWTRGWRGTLCVTQCPAENISGEPTGYWFAFSGVRGNPTFAYGNASNYADLTFGEGLWPTLTSVGDQIVGRPAVVWHKATDTYFDIEFSHWQCCGGGGFSYKRSSEGPISVSIDVSGGTRQECADTGGSTVAISADVKLTAGAELASIDWTIDGASAGSGGSITPFLALGSHTVEVLAVATMGESDTDSVVVDMVDTTPPVVDARFLDRRTGEPVSSISGNRTRFVTTSFGATDVCDPKLKTGGVVTPAFEVDDGDTIRIQGNNRTVDLPTTALELSVTAMDASGNSGSAQAILSISE